MEVHLVRHACAGRKQDWPGPDDDRPLDAVGVVQADALGDLFAPCTVARVLASPTRRCIQTVEPIAARHGTAVEAVDALGTGVAVEELIGFLLAGAHHGAVLCTHGEVMQGLLPVLRRSGCLPPGAEADLDRLLAKGVVWTLELTDDRDAPFASLQPRTASPPHPCTVHDEGGRWSGPAV